MTIRAFGASGGENWKLDRSEPNWAQPIVDLLSPTTKRLFLPVPYKMNGLIAPQNHFKGEGSLNGTKVFGGIHADGVRIGPGEGFGLMSGDCPTVIIYDGSGKYVFAAHCGLKDLVQFDSNRIGTFALQSYSVIQNIITKAHHRRVSRSHLHAAIVCGIRTGLQYRIDDEKYGEKNLALQNWCKVRYPYRPIIVHEEINMVEFVKAELEKLGIPPDSISTDQVDTFSDKDKSGEPLWASHSRDGSNKRNLVLVEHH